MNATSLYSVCVCVCVGVCVCWCVCVGVCVCVWGGGGGGGGGGQEDGATKTTCSPPHFSATTKEFLTKQQKWPCAVGTTYLTFDEANQII